MTSWKQFCEAAPELARRVEECFRRGEHHTMATLRRDGSPRISGTCVELGDEVSAGMMPGTRRAEDLRRDPRVAIHSQTLDPDYAAGDGAWAGEAKLAGRARETSPDRFAIELEELTHTRAEEGGLTIEHWHHERGLRVFRRS